MNRFVASILTLSKYMLLLWLPYSSNLYAETVKTQPISLQQGQVISIAIPQLQQGDAAKAALDEYFKTAFPLARSFGMDTEAQFKVAQTILGRYQANSAILFSWPNTAAEQKLTTHPDWPAIKALRPTAWQELDIFTAPLTEDFNVTLRSDKFYTLAVAWFSPEHPTGYDNYMASIKDKVAEVGGTFLLKLRAPAFETLGANKTRPGQVTLVEWDSRESLSKLLKSQVYKDNQHYRVNGTSDFSFYAIEPSLKSS